MIRNQKFQNLIYILIAGMGNVKKGNRQGMIIYFSLILLLGLGLIYAEQKIIEQYYHPSQTIKTFAVLIYLAFAFFWNGSKLLGFEEKNRIFENNNRSLTNKDPGDN